MRREEEGKKGAQHNSEKRKKNSSIHLLYRTSCRSCSAARGCCLSHSI
jgi:hypothetical protein